jgi:hypothetical protein
VAGGASRFWCGFFLTTNKYIFLYCVFVLNFTFFLNKIKYKISPFRHPEAGYGSGSLAGGLLTCFTTNEYIYPLFMHI